METGHQAAVILAKSWGLFYLIGLAIIVLVYALWPSNGKRFDRAKHSILEHDDKPGEQPDGT